MQSTPPVPGPGAGAASLDAVLEAVREDLAAVDDLTPAEQLVVLGRVHSSLSAVLASTAGGGEPGGPSATRPGPPQRPGAPGRPGGR